MPLNFLSLTLAVTAAQRYAEMAAQTFVYLPMALSMIIPVPLRFLRCHPSTVLPVPHVQFAEKITVRLFNVAKKELKKKGQKDIIET